MLEGKFCLKNICNKLVDSRETKVQKMFESLKESMGGDVTDAQFEELMQTADITSDKSLKNVKLIEMQQEIADEITKEDINMMEYLDEQPGNYGNVNSEWIMFRKKLTDVHDEIKTALKKNESEGDDLKNPVLYLPNIGESMKNIDTALNVLF